MNNLSRKEYRSSVLGCWMGKNVGGTLGAPFEWRRQVNDVKFYTTDLKGEPLPNDDLDIQLLWVIALEQTGIDVDAKRLAEYWSVYLTPHWAEYGNSKANLRAGLVPPLSGSVNNDYKHSCGAFIRSEIWACIAPGNPQLAARFALEDAIIDHGDGEGTYAEVFCAALESAAFVVKDIRRLIGIGLSYIPPDCGIARAVKCAIASYDSRLPWRQAREEMLTGFRGGQPRKQVSDEDFAKGYADGPLGWDAPSNVGIVVLGLLYGEGEFDKTLITAVNCGEDTDCTAATAGSILGIIGGIEGIPEKWVKPIGRGIKTLVLDLGDLWTVPKTVDDLTERTERLASQVWLRHGGLAVTDAAASLSSVSDEALGAGAQAMELYERLKGPLYRSDFYDVAVEYVGGPYARNSHPKRIRLSIRNKRPVQANVSLRWYLPDGWRILPCQSGSAFVPAGWTGNRCDAEFELVCDRFEGPSARFAVELTIEGRPLAVLLPAILLNGNIAAGPPAP